MFFVHTIIDQERITRAKSPKVKEKSDGKNNKDMTDDTEGKSHDKNINDKTDHDTEEANTGNYFLSLICYTYTCTCSSMK